jgi:CRP-like cAMP-binding protein
LAISDTHSEVLTQLPLRGRLIQSLLYLDGKFGTDADGHSLSIQITRAELGELSNMTTSNAIRTLSQLASEGLVKTEGKKIMLVDKEALKKEISSYADTPK